MLLENFRDVHRTFYCIQCQYDISTFLSYPFDGTRMHFAKAHWVRQMIKLLESERVRYLVGVMYKDPREDFYVDSQLDFFEAGR